jgi:ATP-dependent helicase/nuclease subunit A
MAREAKKPADQAERDRIANDLDVTMMVEAAAGTGKTTSLVTRMVALVVSGKYRATELAAITFTRKAGAQLREKFQEALEKESERTRSPRIGDALAELDRTFLGTTHAFCGRLLRERPVEAGLEPEFRELDEQQARIHAADFWLGWWEARAAAGDERIARARKVGAKASDLLPAFRAVVGNPDVTMIAEETPRPDLKPVCEAVAKEVERLLPLLAPPSDEKDAFGDMIREVHATAESADLDDVRDQVRLLAEAKPLKAVLKRWPPDRKALATQIRDEWLDFVNGEIEPVRRRWREHVHGVLMEVVVPAAEDYATQRKHDGVVTFDDLLLRTRDLLRDFPEVRRYFQSRFRVLLVDEFQDTDPLQAEILFYLTGEETEGKRWRKLVPRSGSLFIVGDPKQSIYRFRRADISTYIEVRELIRRGGRGDRHPFDELPIDAGDLHVRQRNLPRAPRQERGRGAAAGGTCRPRRVPRGNPPRRAPAHHRDPGKTVEGRSERGGGCERGGADPGDGEGGVAGAGRGW